MISTAENFGGVMPSPIHVWTQTGADGATYEMADYGPLRDIFDTGQEPSTIWTGHYSFADRCNADPRLYDRYLVAAEGLNDRYVPVARGANTRCMEDRPTEESFEPGYFDRPAHLGAQATGATPVLAALYRITRMGYTDEPIPTLSQDLETVIPRLTEAGLSVGTHTDDKHRDRGLADAQIEMLAGLRLLADSPDLPPGMRGSLETSLRQFSAAIQIGCIAVDQLAVILGISAKVEARQQLDALTSLLLGDQYDPHVVDSLAGRHMRLLGQGDQYLERDPRTGLYLYQERALDLVKEAADNQPVYVGPHNAVAVVVNKVRGQTLDNIKLSHDTGHEVQVFAQDHAYVANQTGPVLFQPSRREGITPKLARQQLRDYLTARTMYLIKALMAATDGSHHLLVRSLVNEG
jgi:hypothetical protein